MTTVSGTAKRRRPATMRDVAAVAGVSLKTVSRVVNREDGVSAALARRVSDAVTLLDYQHNHAASSLRRSDGKTAAIGLLLEDVSNPFSSTLQRAVEDVARVRRTLVFAASSDEDPAQERELLRALLGRRVDGLIVVPAGSDHAVLMREGRLGGPVVLLDRAPSGLLADSVISDNRIGIGAAVRHLASHGHRRVAFLGDLRRIWTAEQRHLGYVEAMATEAIRLDPALVRQDLSGVDEAAQAVHALLGAPDPPTALLTGQNLVTIGAVQALQERGQQHQVALVGFDDVPLAALLDPGATVVAQDPTAMGRTAAELLFARLDGDQSHPIQVVVPTRLVERGSGEIPAPLRASSATRRSG